MVITNSLLNLSNINPTKILRYLDNLKVKVKSCSLFYYANHKINVFKKVIDKFYNGEFDSKTINLLKNCNNQN